jgi:hypothetical protein
MPLPIIDRVYRIVAPFAGGPSDVSPVNVFHVRALTGIASAVGSLVASAISGRGGNMWKSLYGGASCSSIMVQPLDGHTAAFPVPVITPASGTGSGDRLHGLATVVSLHTTQVGARGRGRVYIGPLGETQVVNDQMDPTVQSSMLAGWGNFINDLNAGTPSTQLVVASYKHADAHDVTTVRVDNYVGVQRRRIDRLR